MRWKHEEILLLAKALGYKAESGAKDDEDGLGETVVMLPHDTRFSPHTNKQQTFDVYEWLLTKGCFTQINIGYVDFVLNKNKANFNPEKISSTEISNVDNILNIAMKVLAKHNEERKTK